MDKSLVDMAVTFKAPSSLLVRKVYLPQLMPYIFSAFCFAFGQTWKIVALAETFGLDHRVRRVDDGLGTRGGGPAREPGIRLARRECRPRVEGAGLRRHRRHGPHHFRFP